MKNFTVAISAGHYEKGQGAEYNGITEHFVANKWVATLEELFDKKQINYFTLPSAPLDEKVDMVNAGNADIAIEIHFNGSANKYVSGCETLYSPGNKEGKLLADIIHSCYSPYMKNKDRGIKEGWYRMIVGGNKDYFLEECNCPAIILEPDFIARYDNINKCMKPACQKIALGILVYQNRKNG